MVEAATLRRGLASFLPAKTVVFCDVWGVVHNGVRAFENAVAALIRFRAEGGTAVLVTNAPVPADRVRHRLDILAVPPEAYDAIATAGDVAIDQIVAGGGTRLCVIGAGDDDPLVAAARAKAGRPLQLSGVENADALLCLGLGPEGDHPRDYADLLAAARRRDLPMICANPDLVVEVGSELVYCAGAIAEIYAGMGGRVIQTGKPYRQIYGRALALAEARHGPVSPDAILAIGDGAATDLAGADAFGIDCLFITSGIHRNALHPERLDAVDEAALQSLLGDRAGPITLAPQLRWTLPGD